MTLTVTSTVASRRPTVPVLKLDNLIQSYAWGSHTAIAALLGHPPSPDPQAELWMGAHPKAPSRVDVGGEVLPLHEAIARDPEGMLGDAVARAYGPRLPFLFKVLAAGQPLSIQAHPDLDQAAEGFDREEALGLARDQRERNYRDRNHKPEILYALTPFTALRGFLPIDEVRRRFDVSGLGPFLPAPVETLGAREILAFFLHLQGDALASAHRTVLARRHRLDGLSAEWIGRLEAHYPGDRGVLAPVFLRLVTLEPGEALFTGPGVLHAYLDGVGVELMASSDNVLRCALTRKHVDAEELLRIARFDASAGRIEPGEAPGVRVFKTPADELKLSVVEVAPMRDFTAPPRAGAEILLCARGRGRLVPTNGVGGADFSQGESFFIPGAAGTYRLEGDATVFLAGVAHCPD
ncbi:MAG: mannose-6-phosphate isomerase, class I [Acidobacteriota bacterium]